jgi:hypothetical protein
LLDQEVVTFIVAALLIGAVVFGGTSLVYFLGQRSGRSLHGVTTEKPHEGPATTRTDGRRDNAA